MERRIITVGDCDISWIDSGLPSGAADAAEAAKHPPLLLFHGLSDSNHTWNCIAPLLARTRRVLMPDLPGHGRSSRPDASYSIRFYARTMAAWILALDRERGGFSEIDLVGHSLGGGVAQRLLVELERLGIEGVSPLPRVRRLVLVSSGGLGKEVAWALRLAAATGAVERIGQPFMERGTRLGMRILGGAFRKLDRATLGKLNDRAGSARALSRTLGASVGLDGQRPQFLDHAHEVRSLPPIAVFWGDRDRVIPVTHLDHALTYLDGITTHRFEGVGHYPHRECIDAFVPALTSFLDHAQRVPSIKPLQTRPSRVIPTARDSARWLTKAPLLGRLGS